MKTLPSYLKGLCICHKYLQILWLNCISHPTDWTLPAIPLKNAYHNQYYVLQNKDGSAMARYNASQKRLIPVPGHRAYGITPRNSEQNFALDALLDENIKLVSITGIAGTGKTLLSLAAALALEREYDQIMLSRPVIPLRSQEMGFLPGDIKEKLAPYMLPLMDNLSVIKGNLKSNSREYVRIEEMQRNEKLLIAPLAYIRGRSLSKVFFIVDESQNLTPHEVKTIITKPEKAPNWCLQAIFIK